MRAVNRPVSWWGWHWEPPVPMSVIELIKAGNMDARLSAMLWVAMERGASIIVAAEPPNSGKTTTVTALLSFTPPDTLAYFTRGVGEPFDVPPISPSYPTYLLINEMSDHIPVYTWDDNARRAFELLAKGYSLATTMHDETTAGVIRQLRDDLHIPSRQIAKLTFVIPMYIGRLGGAMRRILEVVLLRPDGDDGLSTLTVAKWDIERDAFDVLWEPEQLDALANWAILAPRDLEREIGRREKFLQRLLAKGTASVPEVNQSIEGFYGRRSGTAGAVQGEG